VVTGDKKRDEPVKRRIGRSALLKNVKGQQQQPGLFHINMLLLPGRVWVTFASAYSASAEKSIVMKKQMLLVLMGLLAMYGGRAHEKDSTGKEWHHVVTEAFHSMVVYDDIDVILVEDASSTISIQGRTKCAAAVKAEVKDGQLVLSACHHPLRGRLLVQVTVQQLRTLTVRGASEIYSMGMLNSPRLDVHIEGACRVHVKNRGRVYVAHDAAHEPEYVKTRTIQ
jgi:hypothetical protein